MNQSAAIASVVLLSLDQQGTPTEALFQLRDNLPGLPYANQWVFPGGHVDSGESIENGARREFLEETGYVCGKLKYLCDGHVIIRDIPVAVSLYWEIYDKQQKIECYEGQEMRFLRRDMSATFAIPQHLLPWWDQAIKAFYLSAI